MSWRLSESLKTLRAQLNEMFPNRSKVSDGSIGDEKHSSRTSDHNPNEKGVVCAVDITFDDNPSDGIGIDCHELAKVLIRNKDPRIKYIIWNRQICSSKVSAWQWRPYTGTNAHKHHLHISVDASAKLYDDAGKWKLDFESVPSVKPTPSLELLKLGSKGEAVKVLQTALRREGYLFESEIDGIFGAKTKEVVTAFQNEKHLTADGIVGAATRKALGI